ncbi:MAG: biotin carboxylase N-terminal domain-containing protein [Pseudomonadota bacterium]
MITRLLIANRGEIACRIARTARARAVAPIAVYSDADADALHVRMAEAAYRLGPAPSAESYLRIDRLIEAARATRADAVHPGYGFLAENADFAEAVIAEGLTWVGPPPDAIRAMGAKDRAKVLMEAAGVPVVPGYHGADQDPAHLAGEAVRIGYPVLIKARAGGGGKGMRRVADPAGFAEALARARSEAEASFGDAHVLVEKWIDNPRHIEMQVMADRHGEAIHLYERDCSAQRRHQKVIEEAPAPGMTPAFRAAMGAAATAAARACGYVGAGTVEFIIDGAALAARAADDTTPVAGFYFMEMNTRLQVEHPVTEAVTGLDLVALQLDLAMGAHLPAQEAVTLSGHAIEARLYAEDPARGFLPQTGRLDRLCLAGGATLPDGVRVDTGVVQGDTVGADYDPMLAKIIAHGPDRRAAIARLQQALAASEVSGVTTNLGFLARLLDDPEFASGILDTGLIDRGGSQLSDEDAPEPLELAVIAAWIAGLEDSAHPLAAWRAWGAARTRLTLQGAGGAYDVEIAPDPDGSRRGQLIARAETAGETANAHPTRTVTLTVTREGETVRRVTSDARTRRIMLHGDLAGGGPLSLASPGRRVTVTRHDPTPSSEKQTSGNVLQAPLPGRVTALRVAAGDRVADGATLAVIEAMKMEHALTAPRDATVAMVHAAPGDHVAEGAPIITLADERPDGADTTQTAAGDGGP